MESMDKYKQYVVKNLANKESKYMPSLSSISDLSIDGKNNKWVKRWNSNMQDGAEIPDIEEDKEESDSVSVKSKKSESESVESKPKEASDKEFTKEEFEKCKNWFRDHYKDVYRNKYLNYKDSVENKIPSGDCGYTDELTKWALTGLSFWPIYQKIFDDLNKRDSQRNGDSKENPSDSEFCCCQNLEVFENCSSCGRKISVNQRQSRSDHLFNMMVTRSVSGKPVDSYNIKFDPLLLKRRAIDKINISINPTTPGEIKTSLGSKRTLERNSPFDPVEIEPVFGSKHSDNSFDTFNPNGNFTNYNPNTYHNVNIGREIPQRGPEPNLYNCQDSRGIETRKIQHSHDFPDWPGSVNDGHQTVTPNYGVSENPVNGSSGTPKVQSHGVTPPFQNYSFIYTPPGKPMNKKGRNLGFGVDTMNNQKSFDQVYPDIPMDTMNYNGRYFGIKSQEVIDLLNSGVKLHGFKINNKGVNVPLFLNVGTSSSIYSGQGFVSNTSVGLFRISVVEPIDPKVSLVNKIVSLIGVNNYKGPVCKCSNLNKAIEVKKTFSSKQDMINNIFNTFADYSGLPLINFSGSNKGPDKVFHKNIFPSNNVPSSVRICDYHKNLFSHRVDRTKFGKDTFCQLRFMSSITSTSPVDVTRDSFTPGSYISTFFNGFYEQLLCVGDSVNVPKEEMVDNHKFTFIIRQVKGSKYGKNFTIINTTTGQHLCLDLLTHELKFEEECKFSKYLVPAIFKIIPLPTILESISDGGFNCFKQSIPLESGRCVPYYNTIQRDFDRVVRSPTHMSTTDQYLNIG